MGHDRMKIEPVERDCICPNRPTKTHTRACEDAFRLKFFSTWADVRAAFRRAAG